ncbi:MAG: NAD(+) synthase, partial [Candidatus Magasanikbacteria bacterium CG10_big_fil_rev_8_21_14_0_10_43_6]
IPIDPIVSTFTGAAPFFDMPLAVGNMKARVRMTLLYAKANQIGGLVLGTGNKTELLLGYFTKYGDAGVDVLPIASLYKHEVRALAKEMGVPQSILDAAPTAGLWAGQTDEQELGMTYHDADAILHALEKDAPLEEFDEETIAQVEARMHNSEHKRYLPPICELT